MQTDKIYLVLEIIDVGDHVLHAYKDKSIAEQKANEYAQVEKSKFTNCDNPEVIKDYHWNNFYVKEIEIE